MPFHERSKRWSVIVAHRRAGKTVACVMDLITRGLATGKKDARYAYIAPYREQAKTVAWNYLKTYASPVVPDPEHDLRESDLTARLFNGSHVRLFGADNPNALRGMYLDGVVLDEYADMKPTLWGEVIRPCLSDRKGWAVFIGTPRGRNEFWEKYDNATRDDAWLHLMLKASQTKLLAESELADARRTMTEDEYNQEYECSFDAALKGAIFAKELAAAESEGRITRVPHDGAHLVHTAWDIGIGDSTAIWFYQHVGAEVRVIDYYEGSGERAPFYLGILKSKPYTYDTAWLPHDASHQQLTGLSFVEVVQASGLRAEVLPRVARKEEAINAARMVFPRCVIDREKCAAGLEALRAYQWAYNERMGELKNTPVHNWASHGADGFMGLATAGRSSPQEMRLPPLKYGGSGVI